MVKRDIHFRILTDVLKFILSGVMQKMFLIFQINAFMYLVSAYNENVIHKLGLFILDIKMSSTFELYKKKEFCYEIYQLQNIAVTYK